MTSQDIQNLLGIAVGDPIYLIYQYQGRPLIMVDDTVKRIILEKEHILIEPAKASYEPAFLLGKTAFSDATTRNHVFTQAKKRNQTL